MALEERFGMRLRMGLLFLFLFLFGVCSLLISSAFLSFGLSAFLLCASLSLYRFFICYPRTLSLSLSLSLPLAPSLSSQPTLSTSHRPSASLTSSPPPNWTLSAPISLANARRSLSRLRTMRSEIMRAARPMSGMRLCVCFGVFLMLFLEYMGKYNRISRLS